MHDERTHFGLCCRDTADPAPVLTAAHAHGRLDAVLFELTLRQTYRNTCRQVLEVVYTFPLPPMAVLLGFASELNGQRQQGTVVARREAERQYERSLEEGDAPVMLEAHRGGLHTANIGNLEPGDEVVLETRFAQLLGFEQGRLRVSIPTTIAPRHGHAEQAGLQPQQVPQANLSAEYPLSLTLTIGEALSGASVQCPTHRFSLNRGGDGSTRLDLESGARLDRDVVVIVTPREPCPSLRVRADDAFDPAAPVVLMAALQPPPAAPRERISLKLLVDCSGSMVGDSIASARAALRGVVAGLTERDQLSLSRFGDTVEHLFAPAAAKPQALRHLRPLIDGIQADLGGTAMASALHAVFELPCAAQQAGADVLIITDGEIWQAEDMTAAARHSGQRVFAIGVGSSPAEGVLRSLAEATGGACEFATPGEALEAAAQRMLRRMRQPAFTNIRVDWGHTPVWTCGPAPGLFGGDTVIAFAGFAQPAKSLAIRLLADDAQGASLELARAEAEAPCPGDSLPRIAAARRMPQAGDGEALELALRYQLMSEHTHCILVHRREEADKATEQAELHRVSSMLAAGWAGLGTVRESACVFGMAGDAPFGAFAAAAFDIGSLFADGNFGAPDFMQMLGVDDGPASLEAMASRVDEYLARGGQLEGLPAHCEAQTLHRDAEQAIEAAVQCGLSPAQAWLLLAHWTTLRTDGTAHAAGATLLRTLVATIDAEPMARAMQRFEELLGTCLTGGWPSARNKARRARLRAG